MKRSLFLLAGLTVVAALGRVPAQNGGYDPYYVTKEAGAWLICVASYTDDDPTQRGNAATKAYAFAEELRSKFKVPAYVFNTGAEERRQEMERIRKIREACPEVKRIPGIRIQENFAVLVGGYKDMETARKELDKVKKWPAPSDQFCTLGDRDVVGKSATGEPGVWHYQIRFSPFDTAFVVHNPMVPHEQPDTGPDPFLWELNRNESFSLLKISKPWTLVVKVFQGLGQVQPQRTSSSFLDLLHLGNKSGEVLNASALQAHEMAELLRKMKFDAHVLHTRNSSLVCVGGYDSKADPRLARDQQTLAKLHFQGMPNEMQPLTQPMVFEVPRRP
jgi:hypothetical protein